MPLRGTESTFELTTLQRLDALKNQHAFGMDIERPRGGAGGALSLSKCRVAPTCFTRGLRAGADTRRLRLGI